MGDILSQGDKDVKYERSLLHCRQPYEFHADSLDSMEGQFWGAVGVCGHA